MAKSLMGLDIGTYSIKLIEIDNDDGRFRLKNYAIEEIYGDGEDYDIEGPSYGRLTAALKECFKQLKINPRRIKNLNCSIGGSGVTVKQIRSISLSAEELESSLTFEARKHLPLDDTDAILDYQILDGGGEESNMEILLVATTRKAFDYHINLLSDLGVKPNIMDAESTALVNSYLMTLGKPTFEGALIFLDIGAKFSTLIIYSNQGMFFSRDIAIGGHKLTEDVVNLYDLEYRQAEDLKKEKGLGAFIGQDEGNNSSIRIARRKALDALTEEIRRSLRYYIKETGLREFEKILMCGGSSVMPNLNSHLAQALSMTVEIYNPFDTFTVPPGFTESIGTQLAIACGLALREE